MKRKEENSSGGRALLGRAVAALVLVLVLSPTLPARGEGIDPPGEREKCPVCGMFVARYPGWTAAIVYADGRSVYFDGVKDMLTYHFDPGRYTNGRSAEDVESLHVTDYYTQKAYPIAAVTLVAGSDVYGPMGKELVPVAGETELAEFLADHGGRPLRFKELTAQDLP